MGAVYCGVLDICISTTLRFRYDLTFTRINIPSINFQCREGMTSSARGQEVYDSKSGLRYSVNRRKRITNYSIFEIFTSCGRLKF
jgi:hypothetical protein